MEWGELTLITLAILSLIYGIRIVKGISGLVCKDCIAPLTRGERDLKRGYCATCEHKRLRKRIGKK